MARINCDLGDVDPKDGTTKGGWRALEEGDYEFMVTESDYRRTRAGDGWLLELKLQCLDERHPKARLREYLTIDHPNPDAVRINKARLAQIGIACNVRDPKRITDSEELHNRPFIASVLKVPARDAKYGDVDGMQNEIAEFKPKRGSQRSAPAEPRDAYEPPPHTDDDIPF